MHCVSSHPFSCRDNQGRDLDRTGLGLGVLSAIKEGQKPDGQGRDGEKVRTEEGAKDSNR